MKNRVIFGILFGLLGIAIVVFPFSPLPDIVIKVLTNIFVVLLIGLMLYVTFSDSRRLFRRFVPATEGVKNAPQNP